MDIYDPISKALNIEPMLLDENFYALPHDAIHVKWAHGSSKGNKYATGRPKGSFKDYIFVTNGIIEKIVHKDKIPVGLYPGRIRECNPKKIIIINGIEYESGRAAAKALNISQAMVTYLRKKQSLGRRPW